MKKEARPCDKDKPYAYPKPADQISDASWKWTKVPGVAVEILKVPYQIDAVIDDDLCNASENRSLHDM